MDRGLIRSLRWQDLELDRPDGQIVAGRFAMLRSKTGKVIRQELSRGAVEALRQASRNRHTRGIVGCNFRTFRHTFATRALRRGVPREVVAKMIGHVTAFITERYMHVADDQLLAAARALNGPERFAGSTEAIRGDRQLRDARPAWPSSPSV